MKVLEFAFDPKEPSNYLPHNQVRNCICYTATHDNCPLMQWKEDADPESVAFAEKYLSIREEEGFNWGVIRGGMGSVWRVHHKDWNVDLAMKRPLPRFFVRKPPEGLL